jgi:flagellar motor switch protein FliM
MNMAGTFAKGFAGARPLAEHCAELIRSPQPDVQDRLADVVPWCRDLGQELTQELSQLFSAGKLRVSVAGPEMLAGRDCFERIGPIAANSLLRCTANGEKVLLSLDFTTALALTDCSFGGDGKLGEEPPQQLPGSAELLVQQLAGMIAQAIAITNGSAETLRGDVLVRSDTATRLKPFGAEAKVAIFTIVLAMEHGNAWETALFITADDLPQLLPGSTSPSVARRPSRQNRSQVDRAFAELPLTLEAVLSEFDLTLTRLGRLAAGDEIPLAIPDELALRVGDDVFAHGRIGTAGNRMALQLTRVEGQPAPGPREPTKEISA